MDTSTLSPAIAALVRAAAAKSEREGNMTVLADGFRHFAATREQADDFRKRAERSDAACPPHAGEAT
jgi:uncharacterized protein (DUF2141 family)